MDKRMGATKKRKIHEIIFIYSYKPTMKIVYIPLALCIGFIIVCKVLPSQANQEKKLIDCKGRTVLMCSFNGGCKDTCMPAYIEENMCRI